MTTFRALLSALCCAVLLAACRDCPEPPEGGGGQGGQAVDPNPPIVCDGPGAALAGAPCITDCDCCGLWCADYTPADGGAPTRACASDCMGKVRP